MVWYQPSNREKFLEKNLKDLCPGKRVLDFCCGSGMNGIDALRWGASHVTFTDVRRKTFENHFENSKILSEDNHQWIFANANDIESCYESIDLKNVDIIIYHGHFYHANNHTAIIKMFSESSAEYIVFETKGLYSEHANVFWHSEESSSIWNVYSDNNAHELVGAPTSGFCTYVFGFNGFEAIDHVTQDWRHREEDEPTTQVRTMYKRIRSR